MFKRFFAVGAKRPEPMKSETLKSIEPAIIESVIVETIAGWKFHYKDCKVSRYGDVLRISTRDSAVEINWNNVISISFLKEHTDESEDKSTCTEVPM